MQQALFAGKYLDERAEVLDAGHFTGVDGAYFHFHSVIAHHRFGGFEALAVGAGDEDRAVVVYLYVGAGLLDYPAYVFSARPDELADLIFGDMHLGYPGSVLGDVGPRCGQVLFHEVKYVVPAGGRLLYGLAEDVQRYAGGELHVHLEGGDAFPGPGQLEVHIAEVVFEAGDVGEDGVL